MFNFVIVSVDNVPLELSLKAAKPRAEKSRHKFILYIMSSNPKHTSYNAGILQTDIKHQYSDGVHSGIGNTKAEALDAFNEAKDRSITYKDNTTWMNRNSFLGDGEHVSDDE